jgi:5'(3')-deoxyribonucleotidase
MERADFWAELEPMPHAVEAVRMLRQTRRHTIVWASAPWWECREWAAVRRDWLYRHFTARDDEMMFGSEKQLLRGDILIEDNPKTALAWRDNNPHGVAYLYDQPYTKSTEWPERDRFDWARLVDHCYDDIFEIEKAR